MDRIKLDYIIIGQGLAGSAVAFKLLRQNRKILVIDDPDSNTSSRVAAGLFNPVTGKRMVKTWFADKLFPALHMHYRSVEALCGDKLFHPMPIYRPFHSVEEQNEWMGKSSEEEFSSYVTGINIEATVPGVNDAFGGLILSRCGYLDTSAYIAAVRKLLVESGSYLNARVQEDEISFADDRVLYNKYECKGVIYCNGTHSNKWFDWLPIRPLKGEALTISAKLGSDKIINRGVYVVPGRGAWRVGATYNFHDSTPQTTLGARVDLGDRLRALISLPFEITGQEWGFRPTTPNHRPIVGRHPEIPQLWILNGLGTKGVSLAPYFADLLIRAMEHNEPLNKDVDIERFKFLYWTSPN